MMKNSIATGNNRTGIELSPIDKQLLIEGALQTVPSMDGDERALEEVRASYLDEEESIGSMPPPVSIKGLASTVVNAMKGASATAFLDKLGERLAFERTGSRLYAALLGKFDASEKLPGGPTRADLEKIHREETEHFEMLRQTVLSLGADPTAITPSADVAAVTSMGLIQVIGDPRMTFKQSLEAILVAELVDNSCWTILVDMARAGGQDEIAARCELALREEDEHLSKVQNWVKKANLGAMKPMSKSNVME